MHKELYIVKGVPKAEGDTDSQEIGEIPLSLMNTAAFALKTDGWTPQIAQFQGAWKETNLTDGRELIAGKNQNVVETMQLSLVADTHAALYDSLVSLNRMAEDARLFHQSDFQLEPVYLKWWAECGAGYQYAIIFNIDVVPGLVDINQSPNIDITLTIEREPYWRGLAPGVSPKKWTDYWRPGQVYTGADSPYYVNVVANNKSLINQQVTNFTNFSTNAFQVCDQGYIDIDAADVPGDAPALLMLGFDGVYYELDGIQTAGRIVNMMIARYSRPLTRPFENNNYPHTNTLLASPAAASLVPYSITLGTDAATAADTGARGRKTACTDADVKNRVGVSFATATDQIRMTWGVLPSVMTGRYAAFLRGGQRGGSFGDTTVYLEYGWFGDDARTDTVNPALTAAAPSEFWGLTYLGTIDIPTGKPRLDIGVLGLGVNIQTSPSFTINLRAARSTGSSTLYIQDLVLMPIDEGNITVDYSGYSSVSGSPSTYDNTGYFLHGAIGDTCFNGDATPLLSGSPLYVRPGVTNRFYFLHQDYDAAGSLTTGQSSVVAAPGNVLTETEVAVRVIANIIPRWTGIRDA